jgi:hypothetical protein
MLSKAQFNEVTKLYARLRKLEKIHKSFSNRSIINTRLGLVDDYGRTSYGVKLSDEANFFNYEMNDLQKEVTALAKERINKQIVKLKFKIKIYIEDQTL